MPQKDPWPPHVDRLLETMEQICHDLAWGRYDRAEELFSLTGNAAYPARIASLAESFGMMLVKVEAREYRMEGLLDELKQASQELEASRKQLISENARLRTGLMGRFAPRRIVSQSPVMRQILDQVERLANTTATVLVTGETGTGKELVAKALHYGSLRQSRPFIAVNCSAIPESLFESELFGIEKGVATGVNMRRGLMEQAQGGTIFLDEICDTPLNCQGKVLRVLEERELTRVGGTRPIPLDVRVVAATNKNPQAEIQAGRFRQDLYYRLNVVSLDLPPLRERTGDIPLLIRRFLEFHCREMNRPLPRIDKKALAVLLDYSWPGNVRELKNEMERLVALSCATTVRVEDLSPHIRGPVAHDFLPVPPDESADKGIVPALEQARPPGRQKGRDQTLAASENRLIQKALQACGGNKTKAAGLLGISREGLRKKLLRMQDLDARAIQLSSA